MTKFSLFYDATEISNMAAGGHSNMAQKNTLVIFTFKVVEGNILAAF